MEQLNELKKYAPMVAGIALILYAVIGLIGGGRFLTTLFYIGILVLGVTSFLENTEAIRVGALGLSAVSLFFSLISTLFTFLRFLFSGYFGFMNVVFSLISLLCNLLEVVAILAMAAFVYMAWKKIDHKLRKYYYAPAALVLLSVILSMAVSFLGAIIGGYFGFGVIFSFIKAFIISLIFAVGLGALGLNLEKEETPEN